VCGPATDLLPGVAAGPALGVGLAWVCGPALTHPVSNELNMPNTIAAARNAALAKTQTYFFVLIAPF